MYYNVIKNTNEVAFHSLAVVLFFFWLLGREKFLAQIASGPIAIACVTVVVIVFNIFGEWGFHKYILHRVSMTMFRNWPYPFRWLYGINISFWDAHHNRHHPLTPPSRYAIMEEGQAVSSHFPPWTYFALVGAYLPFLLLVQWVAGAGVPILLGGIAGVFFSYYAYEFLHTLYHTPYWSFWEKKIATPGWRGAFWKWWHDYHEDHHKDTNKNFNIVFPLADFFLGTMAKSKAV